ncbi:MAG: F0F1 ATP synthase subunit delta [Alphaproteobacteria bacterium]|nr:F0F1 ATP synthase subunit delta [Alphaproteobacteria bacterium]
MAQESSLVTGIAGRYATALFDLASEGGALDAVANDLRLLQTMINESGDLRRLIRSPVISRDDQNKAMAAVLARAGIGGLVQRFVGLCGANRRLFVLPDMILAYRQLLSAHRGEVVAEVAASMRLSDAQVADVKRALRAALGQDVELVTRVDASLLGGLVVKVGSRMIDSSLKTKLTKLELALKGVG